MQNGLDRLLATYCSPTLAGIKPASLVSCDRNLYPDLPQRLKEYRDAFSAREIHFEIVCACSARFLLLVYSKPQLERRMADPQVQHVLRHFAYPVGQPLDVLLRNLKRRIAMSKDFPHEIGLFLGYPIEDVVGFIRYAGKGEPADAVRVPRSVGAENPGNPEKIFPPEKAAKTPILTLRKRLSERYS